MEITAFAPPSEAHARIAYALTEVSRITKLPGKLMSIIAFQVRKYLIPDSNDEIRQEQMREMELLNTTKTVGNTDGLHDDMGSSDLETGSSSPQGSSPSPPSSTVIAMRGVSNMASNGGRQQRYHLSNQGNEDYFWG